MSLQSPPTVRSRSAPPEMGNPFHLGAPQAASPTFVSPIKHREVVVRVHTRCDKGENAVTDDEQQEGCCKRRCPERTSSPILNVLHPRLYPPRESVLGEPLAPVTPLSCAKRPLDMPVALAKQSSAPPARGNRLSFVQQRIETCDASLYRPRPPSTPVRIGCSLPRVALEQELLAPPRPFAIAYRRDPKAPMPSLDLMDNEDEADEARDDPAAHVTAPVTRRLQQAAASLLP